MHSVRRRRTPPPPAGGRRPHVPAGERSHAMTGRRWRLFAGIASTAAVFCAGIILGLPFSSHAQQPAKPARGRPADSNYVGAEICKGCHEEAFSKFSKTRMGRLFLLQARNPKEANACETCHGPGKAHVDAGGGKGKGGLITFAKNDQTPVEKRNAGVPRLPHQGRPDLLAGEHPRVARRGVHELPQGDGEGLAEGASSPRRPRSRPAAPATCRSGRRRCGPRTCRSARAR